MSIFASCAATPVVYVFVSVHSDANCAPYLAQAQPDTCALGAINPPVMASAVTPIKPARVVGAARKRRAAVPLPRSKPVGRAIVIPTTGEKVHYHDVRKIGPAFLTPEGKVYRSVHWRVGTEHKSVVLLQRLLSNEGWLGLSKVPELASPVM